MTSPLSPGDLAALKDKSVLIPGGSSGLGLETVQLFTSAGAYVTIADVQPPLDSTVLEDGHAQYVHCDVSNWESQVEAFKKAIRFGPSEGIDVVATFAAVDFAEHLVDFTKANVAASSSPLDVESDPVAPSTRCLDINLKGSFFTAALALHYFQLQLLATEPEPKSEPKSLTFVSSLAAYLDDTHNTSYTTSKFGTRGIFRALRARAHAEMNVRVNLIAPWGIRTPMTAPLVEMLEKAGIKDGQGFTFASKEDVARAVGRCAVDEELHGRAIAIVPEGAFDIKDDITGGYGGDELRVLMEWRKQAGDFLQG